MKPATRAPMYAAMYPALSEIARQHGYALLIHGSMQRDFDLVACPWTDEAGDPEALMRSIADAFAVRFGDMPVVGYAMKSAPRPHGRVGWSIHLERDVETVEAYLDLSVMPRASRTDPETT